VERPFDQHEFTGEMVRRQDLNHPEIKGVLKNNTDGGNAVPPVTEIGLFKTWEGRDSFPTVLGSRLTIPPYSFRRARKSVLIESRGSHIFRQAA